MGVRDAAIRTGRSGLCLTHVLNVIYCPDDKRDLVAGTAVS